MADNKINLIIVGNNEQTIHKQESLVRNCSGVNVKTFCQSSFINSISELAQKSCDILVTNLSSNGLAELKVLSQINNNNTALIIIGVQTNVELLKQAINVGVKDFIDVDEYDNTLVPAVKKLKNEVIKAHGIENKNKRFNAFINAKGGAGASFIASNIGYALSKYTESRVALIDLDLQFGAIGLNFDVVPKYSIGEAINSIAELDTISAGAYLTKYNDNLGLLLPSSREIVLPGELSVDGLRSLIELLQVTYSQVIVDLPRIIDPLSNMVMEQADQVTIVLQQSLAQYRDGRRLISILNKDLDIPLERISVVINRYDQRNSLTIEDMIDVLNHEKVYVVTNDYEQVVSASNLGVPLCESSPKSRIARDLKSLARNLGKVEFVNNKKGFFKSMFL